MKQHRCYIVATCDRDLRRRIRKIAGVPIMFIQSHRWASGAAAPPAPPGGAAARTGTPTIAGHADMGARVRRVQLGLCSTHQLLVLLSQILGLSVFPAASLLPSVQVLDRTPARGHHGRRATHVRLHG